MNELAFRFASASDCELLGTWNKQLIEDEGHDNAMSIAGLIQRMREWLALDYRAVIFEECGAPVAYALSRDSPEGVHLRQFFVDRGRRRRGVGSRALALLIRTAFTPGRRVVVEAMAWNEGALSFWRSAGFVDRYVGLQLPGPAGRG